MSQMKDKILNLYWAIIPYDYRPRSLWYKLRGLLWDRYNTVRCRYLSYTWNDRVEVLTHVMFEVLSEFIEKECSPGIVDWEKSAHSVEVNGKLVNVRDEMQSLYDWWHIYRKEYEEVNDIIWRRREKILERAKNPDAFIDLEFDSEEDAALEHTYMMASIKLDELYEQALTDRLHRIVKIRRYMWT